MCFIRLGSCLIHKHYTILEMLARHKHSSLLRKIVSTAAKSFMTLPPGVFGTARLFCLSLTFAGKANIFTN